MAFDRPRNKLSKRRSLLPRRIALRLGNTLAILAVSRRKISSLAARWLVCSGLSASVAVEVFSPHGKESF